MAPRFDYAQAEEIRDAFGRRGVRYLFIGKSGAILLGYPDTTQDADLFLEKSPANGSAAAEALRELGFELTPPEAAEIVREVGVVAATSANLSGGPDPRRIEDVPEEIRAACGAIVDAGELPGTPSTILDLRGSEPVVLRQGAGPLLS